MSGNTDPKRGKVYLVSGRRTPFGRFGGAYKSCESLDMAIRACIETIEDTKLDREQIDQVIVGNVIQSTPEMTYLPRHLGLDLKIGIEKPAHLVNRLCGSGMQAIMDAYRLISLGEASCVLAGGVENMSAAPHLMYGARFGTKYGAVQTRDSLIDTLFDKHIDNAMGITAENIAKKFEIPRALCDEFALSSHKKAIAAYESNLLTKELTTGAVGGVSLTRDEHLRGDIAIESLANLRASFKKEGVVTAGNASGIVDGAAFVLVASEAFVNSYKLEPLAQILDFDVTGVDPHFMGMGPVASIQRLLKKTHYTLDEIDLFEINEAFASQVIACRDELKIQDEKLNIWGGAIALGHPLGATGTRLALTMAHQLKYCKRSLGVASACIGGGQGISILLKNVNENK